MKYTLSGAGIKSRGLSAFPSCPLERAPLRPVLPGILVFIFDFALDRALAHNIIFSAKGHLRHGVRPPLKNILLWFGCYRQHSAFSLDQGAYRRVRHWHLRAM